MASARVLIVDDENVIRMPVRERLAEDGYQVREAASAKEARKKFSSGVDLVLLDIGLPDADGLTLLQEFREDDPELVVIMMTGDATAATAVSAMKKGAFHYCVKPVDLDELSLLVRNALEATRLRREVQALRTISGETRECGPDMIIGSSPAMVRVRDMLEKIARSPASTVLITGETGTGKDLAARALHACSERATAPLMNITCTALPDTLFESELFGHERGSFTGAAHQRKGLLEQADGGTVFLDEIAELPLNLQAKLLRFLEDKTLRRIGGTADIAVDARVVAATNRNLGEMVKDGSFREDLYYRLQVLPLELPPLRERTGDAEELVKFFADLYGRRFRKTVTGVDPEAMRALARHPWPGNVRELRNAVERAVLLSEGEVLQRDDFLLVRAPSASDGGASGPGNFELPPDGVSLEEVERQLVIQALERTNGNQTRAATLLGINRDQMRYRIQKFNLDPSRAGESK